MSSTPPSCSGDAILVRAAIAGRREAVGALVDRLMPIVYATVRRALRNERGARIGADDGDDLVQEIWLHLIEDDCRRLLEYDPTRGISLESYVVVLAEREVVDQRRKAAAQKRGGHLKAVSLAEAGAVASPTCTPEERTSHRNLVATLQAELERELPDRGLLVWRYVFTDGLEPKDVARLIGVKVQVVYNWQHKIRTLARELLRRDARADQTS